MKLKTIFNKTACFLIFLLAVASGQLCAQKNEDLLTAIYTPNGSRVWDSYLRGEYLTEAQMSSLQNETVEAYPGIEIITDYADPPGYWTPSTTYNCHGYAWYMTESGCPIWIGLTITTAEDIYWQDNSYVEVDQSYATKISYTGNHSAITTNTPGYCISKWGRGVLAKHRRNDVPIEYGSAAHFYRRAAPSEFIITSPKIGESWILGNLQQIKWLPGNAAGQGMIHLYLQGASIGIIKNSVNLESGYCDWNVGSLEGGGAAAAGNGYTIRIVKDGKLLDESDGFSISNAGGSCFYSPIQGESIPIGTTYRIRWDGGQVNGVDSGRIFLDKDGGWKHDLANYYDLRKGYFDWFVDKDYYQDPLPVGSGYTIRLVDGNNATLCRSEIFSLVPLKVFTIMASAGPGGTVTPSGSVPVNQGSNQTFTITAHAGYAVQDVLLDHTSQEAKESVTLNNIQSDHTVEATFAPLPTYTITATAGAGGTIDPSGNVSVYQGASQTFAIAADSGYTIQDVSVDQASQGPVSSYKFEDINGHHTIEATFVSAQSYTITATAGPGGAISPSGQIAVQAGGGQTFLILPDSSNVISDIKVNGASQGPIASYAFVHVNSNQTIEAIFKAKTFTVTADVRTGHGWILPEWTYYKVMTVNCNDNVIIQLAPQRGYVGYYIEISGSTNGRFNYPWDDRITISNITANTFVTIYYRQQ